MAGTVDFDLHGLVGVRLVGASPGDVAAVTAQLGPIQAPLDREPDIVIRFAEDAPVSGPRYLGRHEVAFTDDAFLVVRSKHRTGVRVQIPLDRAGHDCEIVCESGLPAVPLLIPIVNLTALAKGVVPLHAAAFRHRGKGVVVTGWAKGGKTESLLGFASHGAQYIGDEWVYIAPDGGRAYGIPEPIRLWDWHLDELPAYRAVLDGRERAKLRAVRGALRAGPGRGAFLRRLMSLVEQQAWVLVEPERLFGPDACPLQSSFDKLFLTVSHGSAEVTVEEVDPLDVARRMVFSLQHERLDLLAHYLKFRFAFPDRPNALIEHAEEMQRAALERALAGKEAYVVAHPYPAPIRALYEVMDPLI